MTNQVSVDKAIKKGKQILLLMFIIGAAIMAFVLFSLGKYTIAVFLILFFFSYAYWRVSGCVFIV